MKVRTFTAGIGVAALAVSGLALGAVAPASADPTNPVFTPSAGLPDATTVGTGDIVGVGSDTIEHVLNDLAEGITTPSAVAGWNAGHASQRIASFDATPQPSTITLRTGTVAISRPNGSGQGKATLFNPSNPNVSFARSSSSLSTSNGEATSLKQFPFAVDGLKMAVKATGSDAPASVTIADVVNIYKGVYKTWNQIPGNGAGSTAFIHPYIPQSGSGTRSFFLSELKAGNGGVDVTLAAADGSGYLGVSETQEHSPTDIQANPDAIAPFSTARATTLTPGLITLEGGYRARRAVYNVVRNADAGAAWVTAIFGEGGYLCSADARTIIKANGFEPLDTTANPGGQCGLPLTTAPSNLNVFGAASSTTTLDGSSPSLHTVHLDATVSSGAGVVQFFDGSKQVGGDTAITAGHATLDLNGVTGGSHTYTAKFLSTDTTAVNDSQGSKTIVVHSTSTTTATVAPGTFGHGGSATVAVSAEGTPATGIVTIHVGSWSDTKALSGGSASFTVPGTFAAGSQSFSANYLGTANIDPSADTKVYTVGKSSITLAETYKAKIKPGKRAIGTIVVGLSPASTVFPNGTIVIKKGTKVVGRGTLVNGVVKIKLAKLPRGKNKLVATYSGSADVLGGTLRFLIVQK
jgi:hypothetical protein